MAAIARTPGYFTYLADAPGGVGIVIGDARLSLTHLPAQRYDVLVLDVFSSDAVPVHLLTHEALELYLTKMREHGVLVFNVTNRCLDLEPVLARLADE